MKDISPVRSAAISALISEPSIVKAAKKAGISERTLQRWMKQEDFRKQVRRAVRETFGRSQAILQELTTGAAGTLGTIMRDKKASAAARARSAIAILQLGRLANECTMIEEVEELVKNGERRPRKQIEATPAEEPPKVDRRGRRAGEKRGEATEETD